MSVHRTFSIIQYDGFILNPEAWSDQFLNYDYVGAPWLVGDFAINKSGFPEELRGKLLVGNGGFSLRSKRFTSLCAELSREGALPKYEPEDVVLCLENRKLLETHGMKFSPNDVAKKFSFESKNDEYIEWDGQFGFHGFRWTDISKWRTKHPEYEVDTKRNTIRRI